MAKRTKSVARPLAPARLQTALDDGKAEDAFVLFQGLLQVLDPDQAVLTWLQHGWTAFTPNVPEPLAPTIGRARNDPIAARLLFARVAFGAGHTACGVAAARAAQSVASDQAESTLLLCAMLLKSGDPEAQALLQQCVARAPHPAAGWVNIGAALLDMGKAEAAQICFARGVPSASLAIRQGLLARDRGHRDEARACFTEAVTLDPTHVRAWFLLALGAQDAGDAPAAIEAYRRVLALDPTVAEAWVNLGTVLQDAGDLVAAKTAYRRAVTLRADTFGRVAQALSTAPKGELWLDLAELRRSLAG